tara:strand:- start:2594 stop:3223 length:630 start_codon:yes stop_codon:yes gene_type:complete
MEIRGPKISFDKDNFKPLTEENDFLLIKDIEKGSKPFKKMSASQKNIHQLLTDYEKAKDKIKDNYINVCLKKKLNRYGKDTFDPTIVTWPDYKTKGKVKRGSAKTEKKKRKRKKKKTTKRKTEKIETSKKLIYFYMKDCKWCDKFEKVWLKLKKKNKDIKLVKINGPRNKRLKEEYGVKGYPTLILVTEEGKETFTGKRNYKTVQEFIS